MYPLQLNYITTLPCKTITMKITIFHSGIFLVTPVLPGNFFDNIRIIGGAFYFEPHCSYYNH